MTIKDRLDIIRYRIEIYNLIAAEYSDKDKLLFLEQLMYELTTLFEVVDE